MIYTLQKVTQKFLKTGSFALLLAVGFLSLPSYAAPSQFVTLYISADFSGTHESSQSIERGIKTALFQNNNALDGIDVKIKRLDHHGSTPRAKRHLKEYLSDPTALALFSGLHSPPLLATRQFINENKILVLDPWAAAGPITRYPSAENWIFRLSIDDSKAGKIIVDHAVGLRDIKKPALLLEQTGWGKSNNKTMSKAISEKGIALQPPTWFNWGLTEASARILLRQIISNGSDAVLLVANAPEGKVIAKAMASLPEQQRLPIFSHWGITGGSFAKDIGSETLQALNLEFIQTSFSFHGPLNAYQQAALDSAKSLYPNKIQSPTDIKASSGFIHAYDLTHLLIAASENALSTDNIETTRDTIRKNLENLKQPIAGLIKTYKTPFSQYSENNIDAHEALGLSDFTMGTYGENNTVTLFSPESK